MNELWQAGTLLAAGVGAGAVNAVVGSGALIPFAALSGLGYPPAAAAVAVSVGLTPGGLSGTYGYRRHLPRRPRLLAAAGAATLAGATVGAAALMLMPEPVFGVAIPVCVLASSVLVLLPTGPGRPRPAPPSASVSGDGPGERRRWLLPALAGAGFYTGCFTAAGGIVVAAALATTLGGASMQTVNAVKVLLCGVVSMAASVVFAASGAIAWTPTLLIASGALIGGWLGAVLGQRLHPRLLRALIAVTGLAATAGLAL